MSLERCLKANMHMVPMRCPRCMCMQEAPAIVYTPTFEFPGSAIELTVAASGTIVASDDAPLPIPASSPSTSDPDLDSGASSGQSKGLSNGAIAGISVGAVVLGLLLCACAAYAWRAFMRSKREEPGAKHRSDLEAYQKEAVPVQAAQETHAKSHGSPHSVNVQDVVPEDDLKSRESGAIWSQDQTGTSGAATTRSAFSDPTWLAEEVTVTRKGREGGVTLGPL